jgi:hypothetical protein
MLLSAQQRIEFSNSDENLEVVAAGREPGNDKGKRKTPTQGWPVENEEGETKE